MAQEAPPPAEKPAANPAVPAPKPVLENVPAAPASGAAQRNENVQVNQIDNDAQKEANIRLGSSVVVVSQPSVEASYFAAENGKPPSEAVLLAPGQRARAWHADLFDFHQNAPFNARTYFQVGPVLPSHRNQYGARFGGPVSGLGTLTGNFGGRQVRGMVNGNILIPLPGERTSTATDPAARLLINRFLAAYPNQTPNRPDFDSRTLNTNSPQRISGVSGDLRLDRDLGKKQRISLFHAISREHTDAFQFVAGQNPDTDIHQTRARATYRLAFSPQTDIGLSAGFTRTFADLYPEPNAVGPRVRIGFAIDDLGPDVQFPIHRAQNTFRYGGEGFHRSASGAHTTTFGAELTRVQLNGIETLNYRGFYFFGNNFGRTAVENLRAGAPSSYEVTIGEMERGFRNWQAAFFAGDQWKVSSRLQIYYGLRYALDTKPVEVNNRNQLPYRCDCNNFSPRFSLAWQAPKGFVIRTGYTISFGQVLPVTYSQVRYNLPGTRYLQVPNPDFVNPLRDINLNSPNLRTAPGFISPEIVAPYTHQYNFLLERRVLNGYIVRASYVGSRTIKVLDALVGNRAVPVPGIPFTTATVDQRRPDPRYYDVRYIKNGGIAYLDTAIVAFDAPLRRGATASASYAWGHALDTGNDFSGTAANNDIYMGRAQSQFEEFHDKKGRSNFDVRHALTLTGSWNVPNLVPSHHALAGLANGWQLSGTTLFKTGTPFTLYIGSDAPGFGNVDGGGGERPNILDPSLLGQTFNRPETAAALLTRDKFAFVVLGESRGNLGRNTFTKHGIANLNAAISKQWRLVHESSLNFRAEAYNLGNHPQFDQPQRNVSGSSFGKITNTLNDGRVLQLTLRLSI